MTTTTQVKIFAGWDTPTHPCTQRDQLTSILEGALLMQRVQLPAATDSDRTDFRSFLYSALGEIITAYGSDIVHFWRGAELDALKARFAPFDRFGTLFWPADARVLIKHLQEDDSFRPLLERLEASGATLTCPQNRNGTWDISCSAPEVVVTGYGPNLTEAIRDALRKADNALQKQRVGTGPR